LRRIHDLSEQVAFSLNVSNMHFSLD